MSWSRFGRVLFQRPHQKAHLVPAKSTSAQVFLNILLLAGGHLLLDESTKLLFVQAVPATFLRAAPNLELVHEIFDRLHVDRPPIV
jgi:hypothetical protein